MQVLTKMRERHQKAAEIAALFPEALDIFERMELELGEAEAAAAQDPITQARKRLEARRMVK